LCPQSINPTYAFASLHLTQVVVCGRASRRAGAIWHPHLAHGSVTMEMREVVVFMLFILSLSGFICKRAVVSGDTGGLRQVDGRFPRRWKVDGRFLKHCTHGEVHHLYEQRTYFGRNVRITRRTKRENGTTLLRGSTVVLVTCCRQQVNRLCNAEVGWYRLETHFCSHSSPSCSSILRSSPSI